MIDLSSLVQMITGKGLTDSPRLGGRGIATGGEFAALVQLAAQAGPEATGSTDATAQAAAGGLRLVVDNAGPAVAGLPVSGTMPEQPTLFRQLQPKIAPTVILFREAAKASSESLPTSETPVADGEHESPKLGQFLADADKQILSEDPDATYKPETTAVAIAVIAPQPAAGMAQATPLLSGAATTAPQTLPGVAEAAPALPAVLMPAPQATTDKAQLSSAPPVAMTPAAAMQAELAVRFAVAEAGAGSDRAGIMNARAVPRTEGLPPPVMAAQAAAPLQALAQAGEATANAAGAQAPALTLAAESISEIASDDGAPAAPTPLRAIVEMLPPVIQTELGQPGFRAPTTLATGLSTAQALGSQVIDMGVSGQWIDRMAREISSLANGEGHSRFTLSPPNLGRLQVDLILGAEGMDVHLLVESDEAAYRLNEGRSALQADARLAAMNLGQITVEKASSSSDNAPRDQGQAARDPAGQAQHQQHGDRQAQGRSGQEVRSGGSSRAARDQSIEPDEAAPRATARNAADGHVRFA